MRDEVGLPIQRCTVEAKADHDSSSFKAANAQIMLDHKFNTRRRLLEFNDESIPDGSTLESLKIRRLAVAKRILGKLGKGTNIEGPGFFVTFGCNTFVGKDVYINRK